MLPSVIAGHMPPSVIAGHTLFPYASERDRWAYFVTLLYLAPCPLPRGAWAASRKPRYCSLFPRRPARLRLVDFGVRCAPTYVLLFWIGGELAGSGDVTDRDRFDVADRDRAV